MLPLEHWNTIFGHFEINRFTQVLLLYQTRAKLAQFSYCKSIKLLFVAGLAIILLNESTKGAADVSARMRRLLCALTVRQQQKLLPCIEAQIYSSIHPSLSRLLNRHID